MFSVGEDVEADALFKRRCEPSPRSVAPQQLQRVSVAHPHDRSTVLNDILSEWDCGLEASQAELFCCLEVAARLGSKQ
jgi:hypothetical protein